MSRGLRCEFAHPFEMRLRRNFRWLDLAPAAPKNIGVAYWNRARVEMRVDRSLMFEQALFIGSVRDRHDVHIAELRTRFAPITVREDVMPPDFAPSVDFPARGNGPVKKRIEARHPHAGSGGFHVLEKG